VDHAPAFLFDLDGTLVDSVHQHVLAWREVLEQTGTELSVWRIHRRTGMSGGLFVEALRETGRKVSQQETRRLQDLHAQAFGRRSAQVRVLPGARELLAGLTEVGVSWAIATSGSRSGAAPALALLDAPADVPVVTRDDVRWARPDPDLFLTAAAGRPAGAALHPAAVVLQSIPSSTRMLLLQRAPSACCPVGAWLGTTTALTLWGSSLPACSACSASSRA